MAGAMDRGQQYDVESGRKEGQVPVHLAVESVRKGFVRKVFSLVAVQLGATALLAAPIASASDAWLSAHTSLFMFSTLGFLAMMLLLTCCAAHLLRQHPYNLLILAGFTALESVSVGFVCATYEVQSVIWCLGATAVIALCLVAFAFNTEIDITGMGSYFRATAIGLFVLGLVGIFVRVNFLQLLYACGGAVLFAGYIVYDTQLIIGGAHKEKEFMIDDYVLAAMSIYMDLVRLFLFLLRLFGEQRRRSR